MGERLYKMEDAKCSTIDFVGTEKECLEYSKENPDRRYNMIEIKGGQNERNNYRRS